MNIDAVIENHVLITLYSKSCLRLSGLGLVCWLVLFQSIAQAQTRQFLDAPVINSQIQLRWDLSKKIMQWEGDDIEPFATIQSNALFLAKRSVYITYPSLNPLVTQATVSEAAVEDSGYATITKLMDAITSVATSVGPVTPKMSIGASGVMALDAKTLTCDNVEDDINELGKQLYGTTRPDGVKDQVKLWISTINTGFTGGKSGPQAIAEGVERIRAAANDFKKNADNAQTIVTHIKACSVNKEIPSDKRVLYAAVGVGYQNPRIQQLIALTGTANQLADLLEKQYGSPEKWMGKKKTDYIISDEIQPTFDKMQNVTVKVVTLAINVDSATSVLSTGQEAAGSTTFTVRRYSSLVPEVGVGAVFGTIKQPKYGTDKNAAGQTVVAKVPDTSISVNPTILANFVCRCGRGPLVPMLQVGAATSKDLPAILVGGGLRLFGLGKGDVAVGGGGMFGWYKDLQKIKVGDVVSGTKDIDADLGFASRPKVGGYVAIQYKF